MISKLFSRRPQVRAPSAPATPAGTVIWAVGDVHGRLDLLKPLIEGIEADLQACDAARKIAILLGDYVDRGPDSRGVIQHLAALPHDRGIEWRFLRGNHEETMLDFLDDPTVGTRWCEYGGDATIRSYGLKVPDLKHRPEPWAHLSADLRHRLSPLEFDFLDQLELSIALGDYFFVHAGARPGLALDKQSPDDLMWIRRSFLDSEVEFEKVIVHGHTPTREIHVDHRRLGIDTKAYDSGVLTALRLSGVGRSLLRASAADEGGPVSLSSVELTPGPA